MPDGEPTDALLTHILSLTQGERLWFEQAVLAGGVVLMPRLPGLASCSWRSRRGRRSSPTTSARRGRGVGAVLEQLVGLVVQLTLVEEVPETDALTDAERLGDGVDDVDVNGRVALSDGRDRGELLAWHRRPRDAR